MSIFAGAPDYSHIIWMPQRFPEGESGIGGLMSGLSAGMGTGAGMGKAADAVKGGGGGGGGEGGGGGGGGMPTVVLPPVNTGNATSYLQGAPTSQPITAPSVSYMANITKNVDEVVDSGQKQLSVSYDSRPTFFDTGITYGRR